MRSVDDVLVTDEAAALLPADVLTLAKQVLTLDLQPAYQKEKTTKRTYGVTLAGWNLRWRFTEGGEVEIFETTQVD